MASDGLSESGRSDFSTAPTLEPDVRSRAPTHRRPGRPKHPSEAPGPRSRDYWQRKPGPTSVASSGAASPSTCGGDDALSESGSTVSGSSYTGSQSGVASSRGYGGDDEFYESDSTVRGFSYIGRKYGVASTRGYSGDDERSESNVTLYGPGPAWHKAHGPEYNTMYPGSDAASTPSEVESLTPADSLWLMKHVVDDMKSDLKVVEDNVPNGEDDSDGSEDDSNWAEDNVACIEDYISRMKIHFHMMDDYFTNLNAFFHELEAPSQRWTGIVASNRSFDGALR